MLILISRNNNLYLVITSTVTMRVTDCSFCCLECKQYLTPHSANQIKKIKPQLSSFQLNDGETA